MVTAPMQWHIKNDLNTTIGWNQYPLVSQYSVFTNTSNFIDMAWRNAAPLYPITGAVANPPFRTIFDLFNNYWRKWYDFTYDSFGRILQMNIVLDYKNIFDLRFNDKIFIKDSWFMVNKITDYEVSKKSSCKVELIRVGEQISIVPPVIINPQIMSFAKVQQTECDVYCMFENGLANTEYFEFEGQLFLDENGNFPAPNGFYSYGNENTFETENGNIINYIDVSSCVCLAPEQTRFENFCIGENVYEASCCELPGGVFYGMQHELYNCRQGWQDAEMLIPVVDGWYHEVGEPFVAEFVNGINVQIAVVLDC
jgi:hypothetical protein